MNGMATAADWMSAASFISMAGLISNMGYGGALFLMGWTGGYVLLAMLLAPYLRKFGKFTVPQFIGDRFYSKSRQHGGGALPADRLAHLRHRPDDRRRRRLLALPRRAERRPASTSAWRIVFVYAVFGGMKGITYTQVAQYVVLIFAYTIPAIFISLQLTGNPIPQLGLGRHADRAPTCRCWPSSTRSSPNSASASTRPRRPGSTLNMFVYTLSLMIGTAGLPHVIMRFFTVPTVKRRALVGRLGAGVHRHPLHDGAGGGGDGQDSTCCAPSTPGVVMGNADLFAPDAAIEYADRPDWMKRWEKTGLLKFEDKNGDGRIQYYNDKTKNAEVIKKAEAAGWKGNELTVNADIIVLANPEIALLPNWVIALVAAGGLAAALSTAAGLLLAISSAISHDLVKNVFMPGHQREGRAAGRQDLDGRRDRGRRLPGAQSAGLRGGNGGAGLRHRGELAVPGDHDGHLQQEDEQGRRDGRHAGRPVHHPVLRVRAQGHLLHQGHRVPGPDRRRQQLLRHHAGSVRCGRRAGELRRRLRSSTR